MLLKSTLLKGWRDLDLVDLAEKENNFEDEDDEDDNEKDEDESQCKEIWYYGCMIDKKLRTYILTLYQIVSLWMWVTFLSWRFHQIHWRSM